MLRLSVSAFIILVQASILVAVIADGYNYGIINRRGFSEGYDGNNGFNSRYGYNGYNNIKYRKTSNEDQQDKDSLTKQITENIFMREGLGAMYYAAWIGNNNHAKEKASTDALGYRAYIPLGLNENSFPS